MLRSFRLENHRSFRDEAELSLLPAYAKDRSTVPVAAIYGANAAGKSNFLDGVRFMCTAVRDSYREWLPTRGVPRSPFRLQADSRERASTYVIELALGGIRHVYGFVVDDDKVREEWLHFYPKGRRRILFDREGMDFELGESLRRERAKTDVLAELTRPNALFLSLAAQVGIEDLMPVYDWLVDGGIQTLDASERLASTAADTLVEAAQRNEAHQNRFLSLLQAADVGISEVVIQQAPTIDFVTPNLVQVLIEQYNSPDAMDSTLEGAPQSKLEERFVDLLQKRWTVSRRSTNPRSTLRFRHGESELFDLADESAGTRSWLLLLAKALSALDRGGLLMIDEIDSSLHSNLTALLIKQFQSAETNQNGAQLLFTTHDSSLLGTTFGEELLARDQIWFVEKDAAGASRLFPLTDFHPRTGENRERRYLTGSYGGVPVIGDPNLMRSTEPRNPNDVEQTDRVAKAAGV